MRTDRVPPHLWFVGSAVFHYLGPSFAVLLFALVPVAGVAWLRIASAALVFAIWRCPWRVPGLWTRTIVGPIVILGTILALMNLVFYHAIDRLPLSTVACIEFVGPVALAATGRRTGRNLSAIVLAALGVYLLTGLRVEDSAALVWAFANAALFTLYIVVAHRLASPALAGTPIDRLAAAMLVAAVLITPFGLAAALPAVSRPGLLLAGFGVGIASSVIPYVFDQMAMRRLSRATYALFVALLPATAVVVGALVLAQVPTALELVAVGLVILAIAIHQEAVPKHPHPAPT